MLRSASCADPCRSWRMVNRKQCESASMGADMPEANSPCCDPGVCPGQGIDWLTWRLRPDDRAFGQRMADGNRASLYASSYLELSGDAEALRNANQNRSSVIRARHLLVNLMRFWYHLNQRLYPFSSPSSCSVSRRCSASTEEWSKPWLSARSPCDPGRPGKCR